MVKARWVIIALTIIFALRLYFSTLVYNPDIWNHQAWMESVERAGWSGLYERDMGERAKVNYPPLTLYSFYLSEKLYQQLPRSVQNEALRATMYKLPSLIADIVIAWLIWKLLPGKPKTKLVTAAIFLLNPAMWYNSVAWGQIESLSALTAMLAVIALVKRRAGLVVVAVAIALLTKQNVLPVIPLLILGILSIKPNWKKVVAAMVLTGGITLLTYAPLVPHGRQAVTYVASTYWTAIAGQSHQHLASVNALNFWYGLGLNNVPDVTRIIGGVTVRGVSNLLTLIGLALACLILIKGGKPWYWRVWRAVVFISLWIFLFTTRMHERHSYMLIAYLTWIYPTLKHKWKYYVLSLISWANVYAVWQGYFWLASPNKWEASLRIMAWIWVVVSLKLGADLLHEQRVKA